MSDPDIYQALGEHNANISSLKVDIKEIKDNQKTILEFIAEQKTGRKYVWILFGSITGLVTLGRDILSTIQNYFTLKGLH